MFKFNKNISIAQRSVGINEPAYIVAEAGVAHFGNMQKALQLVDLAVEAKADAIKFQIFKTEDLISKISTEWFDRLKSKELPFEAFHEIKLYCKKRGITFFATAHDDMSLVFLDELKPPVYKIGSGEIANWAFIKKIAEKGKPVILSTGMYALEDIEKVCSIFQKANNPNLAVLHCVTSYPTPPDDVNLRAITTIRESLEVIAGYSDHTEGIHFPLAAVVLGAKIIEKHISMDFNVKNAQDWKVSCSAETLKQLVKQIREIESGMGTGNKKIQSSEQANVAWAKKSIVADRLILPGQKISFEMLACKRPGNGIQPYEINKVIGRKAKIKIDPDILIEWEMLQ